MDGILIGFIIWISGFIVVLAINWVWHKDDYDRIYYKEANHRCLTRCPNRTDGVMIGSSICGECKRFGGNNDVEKYVLCRKSEKGGK